MTTMIDSEQSSGMRLPTVRHVDAHLLNNTDQNSFFLSAHCYSAI
jgi:hypothetical protein